MYMPCNRGLLLIDVWFHFFYHTANSDQAAPTPSAELGNHERVSKH